MCAFASSIQPLVRRVRESAPVTASVEFRFDDCGLRLDTNSDDLVRGLETYFEPFLGAQTQPDIRVTALQMPPPDLGLGFVDWPRDPGKTGRKDSYVDFADGRACRKTRTGMQYLLGGGERLIFGECLKNINQVVNFLISQYIAWRMHQGNALCHASAVSRNGAGLAIAAFSGGGKSTLAFHLMRPGCHFVSNDRTLIGWRDGRAVIAGVPKQPRVNPGTVIGNPDLRSVISDRRRDELSTLADDALWRLEEKYDVDVGSLYGADRFRLDANLRGLLILNWRRDTEQPTRFEPVTIRYRRDLLAAVMKPPGPFFLSAGGMPPAVAMGLNPGDYLPILDDVPVYEAVGKIDFERAAAFSIELMA